MSETGTDVASIFFRRKRRNRLPRIGIDRTSNLQNRKENCIIVLLNNGEERCISRNVSNFGIKLAEWIKSGTI